MRGVLRDMDIACRIGGDEFLFIIPKVHDIHEIKIVLQRVIDTWSDPIAFRNTEILIAGSIGVAIFPDDANTAKELRQKADTAMYYAKENDLAIKFFT
ncbi:MAG: diguanylate cyclase (GGDEF)-like protein [Alphaproteobacteria bacterium]|jgi:diguanylate cyclase (GGDEF)-like protein